LFYFTHLFNTTIIFLRQPNILFCNTGQTRRIFLEKLCRTLKFLVALCKKIRRKLNWTFEKIWLWLLLVKRVFRLFLI